MRWFGIAIACALVAPACTSLLGIDGDYALAESEAGSGAGDTSDGSTTGVNVTTTGAGGAAPTCDDGSKNGDESDVDCGGDCPKCERTMTCNGPADCASANCQDGICVCPTGTTPSGGDCQCQAGHIACGDGPADGCTVSVTASVPLFVDDPISPNLAQTFLAAHPGDLNDEASYAVFFASDDASGTRLATVLQEGSPVGAIVDVTADARAIGVHALPDVGFYVVESASTDAPEVAFRRAPQGEPLGEPTTVATLASTPTRASSVSEGGTAGAVAYLEDGWLKVAVYFDGLDEAPLSVAASTVTSFAVAFNPTGAVRYGVAFVDEGSLRFQRIDASGAAAGDPTTLDAPNLDLDEPIFAESLRGRWLVGGTTSAGEVAVAVVGADGMVAQTVVLDEHDVELEALVSAKDQTYAVWAGGSSANREARFARLGLDADDRVAVLDDPQVIQRPGGSGDAHVVAATRMAARDAPSETSEIGILWSLASSQGDDGLYLSRIVVCR